MSNRASEPVLRSAINPKILFWVGIGLAPAAVLLLILAESTGMFKLAMISCLGSIVLIGLSVALRRDADDVDAELSDALEKFEDDTRRDIAEIRAQLRQATLDGSRTVAERGGTQPQERPGPKPPKMGRPRPGYSDAPNGSGQYGDEYGVRVDSATASGGNRPEAAFEQTGEMPGAEPTPRRARARVERARDNVHAHSPEPGVYGTPAQGRSTARRDAYEADSLLNGLAPEAEQTDEWRGSASIPRQRSASHDERESRPAPRDGGGWQGENRGTGSSGKVSAYRSQAKQYDPYDDPYTREDVPQRRGSDNRRSEREPSRTSNRPASYMDEHYGEHDRRR